VRRKLFGRTGSAIPVIGQGTWQMGESRRGRAAEIAALRLGLDLGLTHIDTAEMYGRGRAEEIVGEAIRGHRREGLFLVSKVLPANATHGGTIAAAEASLRRLRVDYLDLYLLHWPGHHPIGETMRAMEDLVAAGKIRHLGVSNFDIDEMRQAMSALRRERLACNQVLYNLGQRGIERDLIPFCAQEEVAVVGYTPFGGLPTARSESGRVLARLATQRGASVRQIVLAFLTRQANLFAIPKAGRLEHVRDNAGGDFDLTAEESAAIDAAFPAPRRRVPLATG
jgi:diketogulonate reductase-like aldo/keto reductase